MRLELSVSRHFARETGRFRRNRKTPYRKIFNDPRALQRLVYNRMAGQRQLISFTNVPKRALTILSSHGQVQPESTSR
jgi:hypothetical protein